MIFFLLSFNAKSINEINKTDAVSNENEFSVDSYLEETEKQIDEFIKKCSILYNNTQIKSNNQSHISISTISISTIFYVFTFCYVLIIIKIRDAVQIMPNKDETIPQKTYCLQSLNPEKLEIVTINNNNFDNDIKVSWNCFIDSNVNEPDDVFVDNFSNETYLPPGADFDFFDKIVISNQNLNQNVKTKKSLFSYENWY